MYNFDIVFEKKGKFKIEKSTDLYSAKILLKVTVPMIRPFIFIHSSTSTHGIHNSFVVNDANSKFSLQLSTFF